jgi:hypothetical protein
MALSIRFYPKPDGSGYSTMEIRRGYHWLYADITCPHCDKEQPVAATGYVGGPCVRCGKPTGESP